MLLIIDGRSMSSNDFLAAFDLFAWVVGSAASRHGKRSGRRYQAACWTPADVQGQGVAECRSRRTASGWRFRSAARHGGERQRIACPPIYVSTAKAAQSVQLPRGEIGHESRLGP